MKLLIHSISFTLNHSRLYIRRHYNGRYPPMLKPAQATFGKNCQRDYVILSPPIGASSKLLPSVTLGLVKKKKCYDCQWKNFNAVGNRTRVSRLREVYRTNEILADGEICWKVTCISSAWVEHRPGKKALAIGENSGGKQWQISSEFPAWSDL